MYSHILLYPTFSFELFLTIYILQKKNVNLFDIYYLSVSFFFFKEKVKCRIPLIKEDGSNAK